MIAISLDMDIAKKLAEIKRIQASLPKAMTKSLRVYLMRAARYAMAAKFSGPGTPTNTLKVDTGLARRTVGQSPKVTFTSESRVSGQWGAQPEYVKRHEFGGTYTDAVPAHWRKRSALQARRLRAAVKKGKLVNLNSRIYVSAHTRTTTYRARHMVRDTMTRTKPLLDAYIRRGLSHLLMTGRIPEIANIAKGE